MKKQRKLIGECGYDGKPAKRRIHLGSIVNFRTGKLEKNMMPVCDACYRRWIRRGTLEPFKREIDQEKMKKAVRMHRRGKSYGQIAKELGIPKTTIYNRIQNGWAGDTRRKT